MQITNNLSRCITCNKEISINADICVGCGEKFPTQEIRDNKTEKCKKCKEIIIKNTKICPNCGLFSPTKYITKKSRKETFLIFVDILIIPILFIILIIWIYFN